MSELIVRSEDELRAWLRLTLEPGIGSVGAKNLLARFGLPQQIFAAKLAELLSVVGEKLALQLLTPCSSEMEILIDKTLDWLAKDKEHHILTLADSVYPQSLLDTHDPPILLYMDGQLEALEKPAIAIVGARHATLGGEQNAHAFAKYLAGQDWCVISGLAQGIDAAAHAGALAADKEAVTIAVMGTGINRIYPAENRELALRIKQHGALMSEFPLDTRSAAHHFPMRNRIVAGLSRGVVVVEAAQKSGALITARLAGDLGKEIFAIPGSIHSPLSRGCHQLIRQGAKLVETGQDIFEELRYPVNMAAPQPDIVSQKKGDIPLDFQRILAMIGFEAISPVLLQERLSMDDSQMSRVLIEMELSGLIVRLADGRYQQKHGEA